MLRNNLITYSNNILEKEWELNILNILFLHSVIENNIKVLKLRINQRILKKIKYRI